MPAASRTTVGLWIVAAFAWLSLLSFIGLNLTTPSDGAHLQPGDPVWQENGIMVTPLEGASVGLLPGDVVVAIDGRSMEAWAQALFDLTAARPQWQFGQTIGYSILRNETPLNIPITLGRYPLVAILLANWSTILFGVFNQLVAAFVFFKRPSDPAARILFIGSAAMLGATSWSFGLTVGNLVSPTGFWLFKTLTICAYFLFFISILHFALVFNKLPIAQSSRAIASLYIAPYGFYALYLIATKTVAVNTLDWLRLWASGEGLVPIVYLFLAIVAVIYGYRINRDPVVRQQLRWIVWAVLVSGGSGLILWNLPDYILGYKIIGSNTLGLLVLPFPIALALAILRHRLFDIDIILNRTLVYGALTSIVITLYVAIVGSLTALLQLQNNLFVSLLVTALVALIFQPLRQHLQHGVNRFMYGERDEPYAVLSRLGLQLESTLAPDLVLPTIVETVAQTLKLPYTAITLREADSDKVAAAFGLPTESTLALPLTYQHELIGHLHVARRSPTEPFNAIEHRLLNDIARQAEVAVHNTRLTAELQHSRERLVTAREEERRRIRRDLHDGLGPTLASHSYRLDAALDLIDQNPAAAKQLIADLKTQTQATLADIRRLVYELRPPALDELGLVGALQSQFIPTANNLQVTIESPTNGLPPMSAAVEVAAYRIITEAVNNTARHAHAHRCLIKLITNGSELVIEITDDGCGIPNGRPAGVGLTSMRERTGELGGSLKIESVATGGTRVIARMPIQLPAT